MQSPGHSAHVGQEVVVHYSWHALHGRRLRRHYSEDRRMGRFVHVEVAPGVVIVVAAWMLDPVACAGMELGPPRVSVSALAGLHDLLTERGLRRSCRDDVIVQEEQHDQSPEIGPTADAAIRITTPAEHGTGFREASGNESGRTRDGRRAPGKPADGGRGRRGGGARR